MSGTFRVGLVGLSPISGDRMPAMGKACLGTLMPTSHASAYHFVDDTRIVAVCDVLPGLIEGFQSTWKDVLPAVEGYDDYRTMLANEDLDIVSVVTGDHLHAQIVIDAAEAGVKGIICEKPIATSLTDADRMITAVKGAGIPMLINHTRRWLSPWVQVSEAIDSGVIGKVLRIVVQAGGERAMWLRNGTHLIDLMVWYADSNMQAVYALPEEQLPGYGPRYAGDGGKDSRTDPAISGLVEFNNGVRGFINMDKRAPAFFEIQVWGTQGRIVANNQSAPYPSSLYSEEARIVTHHETRGTQTAGLPHQNSTHSGLAGCVTEMVHLVQHGGEPSSSGLDARKTLEILVGALQSQASHGVRMEAPISDS